VILYRWQGSAPNFGDELNTVLWPALLPGFFDADPSARFLGVGSVLDARHPAAPLKIVAGSAYGGYEPKPRLDTSWAVHWVRGPLTAAALGLPAALALGDPAALAPQALGVARRQGQDIGFMPHFESAARGAWQQAAALAGIRLIDPRDPPLQVLDAIARCRLLLSEALHGVIVADALRVPWIAIRPIAPAHRPKWPDWSATMGLDLRFQALPASTWRERARASPLTVFHATRQWLDRHDARLAALRSTRLLHLGAEALRRAAQAGPQLSGDSDLDRCRSRMLEAVRALRARPLLGAGLGHEPGRTRSRLQSACHSAYQLPVTG